MVIQDKEYNHTLGSLTPLGLVPQSVSTSRSHISSGFPFGMCIEKERRNGCIIYICGWTCEVAKPSGKGGVSVPCINWVRIVETGRTLERCQTQIVDSWNRPVVSEVSW